MPWGQQGLSACMHSKKAKVIIKKGKYTWKTWLDMVYMYILKV